MKKNKKPTFRFKSNKRLDKGECTNGMRAKCAENAVCEFMRSQMPFSSLETPDKDAVRDLITDLFHLCDRMKIDAEEILRQSLRDWKFER